MGSGVADRGFDRPVRRLERPLLEPSSDQKVEVAFSVHAVCLQATTPLASASTAARRFRTA